MPREKRHTTEMPGANFSRCLSQCTAQMISYHTPNYTIISYLSDTFQKTCLYINI